MNTIKSECKYIVFIGRRNVGKSSLINAFLGRNLSNVSNVPGTTTDPFRKTMNLPPYGSVVLVDTAGIDDAGELDEKRISKTIKAISLADFAIVVLDARERLTTVEKDIFSFLHKLNIPFLVAVNKIEHGINMNLVDEIKINKIVHFENFG